MKLNKLIIPVACILLAGNASMAQVIMPWENRTETDGDPFAKGETTATKGKLHLEEIIGGLRFTAAHAAPSFLMQRADSAVLRQISQ